MPLGKSSITRTIYNSTVLEELDGSLDLNTLFSKKMERNETLGFDLESFTFPGYGANSIQISTSIHIPQMQEVKYVPTILENLKFSWIQYLSLFLPIIFAAREILRFAFKHKIFFTLDRYNIIAKKAF